MSDDSQVPPINPHVELLITIAHQLRHHHSACIRFRGVVLSRVDMVSLIEIRHMLSVIRGQHDALITTFDQLSRHVRAWTDAVGDEVRRHG